MHIKFEDYYKVFTPGAPIKNRHFLVGREQEVLDIRRSTTRPGLHPIVIGDRGVGKTSAVVLALTDFKFPFIKITCNASMEWDGFARALLGLLEIDANIVELTSEKEIKVDGKIKPFGIGIGTDVSQKESTKTQGLAPRSIDPWTLFQQVRKLNRKVIIVIDEYDAMHSRKEFFHRCVADLIKTFSDNSNECDSRFVVVGVARSAKDLLGTHESIERSAREIFIRPLRREDVYDFLTEAENALKFAFEPSVKHSIVMSSMGYPYFVHLVGLECLDVMLSENSKARLVEPRHYEIAVNNAVQKAFRSELRKYKASMASLAEDEKKLLKQLVFILIGKNRVERKELQKIMENVASMSGERFNAVLMKLQQERRVLYISRNRDEVRFIDPLMVPFLRGFIFKTAIISSRQSSDPDKQPSLFDLEDGQDD